MTNISKMNKTILVINENTGNLLYQPIGRKIIRPETYQPVPAAGLLLKKETNCNKAVHAEIIFIPKRYALYRRPGAGNAGKAAKIVMGTLRKGPGKKITEKTNRRPRQLTVSHSP